MTHLLPTMPNSAATQAAELSTAVSRREPRTAVPPRGASLSSRSLSSEADVYLPPLGLTVTSTGAFWQYSAGVAMVPLGGPPDATPTIISVHTATLISGVEGDASYNSAPLIENGLIYFCNDQGGLSSQPTTGGAFTTVAANGAYCNPNTAIANNGTGAGLLALSADGQSVYTMDTSTGNLLRISLSQGTITTVASTLFNPNAVGTTGTLGGFLVDAKNAYFTLEGTSNFGTNPTSHNADGTVWSVPLSGGSPVKLADGQVAPMSPIVDSSTLYWTNCGSCNESAQQGTPFAADGSIASVPVGGGSVTTIVSGLTYPDYIGLAGSTLYFLEPGDATVHSVSTSPGAANLLYTGAPLADGATHKFASLVATDNGVYWLDQANPDAALYYLPTP